MKYDEKSGKKIPESRMDEITLSMESLKELAEKCGGAMDREIEIAWSLRDINVTLALIFDVMAMVVNKYGTVGIQEKKEEKKQ